MSGPGSLRTVCVFCGSRPGNDQAFAVVATALGRGLGQRGWRLVYGGGEVGLMGLVAQATLAAGGEVLGVIPERLMAREVAKRDLTALVVTATMAQRKERMLAEADSFVILPGGFGTLDELLEVVTLKQLGYLDAPILIVDVAGAWVRLLAAFEAVVSDGFAAPSARQLYTTVADAEAALRLLDAG